MNMFTEDDTFNKLRRVDILTANSAVYDLSQDFILANDSLSDDFYPAREALLKRLGWTYEEFYEEMFGVPNEILRTD